ncbi:hypothetical protein [Streptomyces sp. NPDC006193]|uniref:hypothetical protein n=1 Tax=Streptomyces sp. NPDC006193 TaxID=3155717 RepID=UPI0033B9B252
MTADVNKVRADVPEDVEPSVRQLTTALESVRDPRVPPQERDGVVRSARDVLSALAVIGDSRTPRALRERLAGAVEQVTSTLAAADRPGVRPARRRDITFIAERSASVLPTIGDRRTSPELRAGLTAIVRHATSVATRAPADAPGEATLSRAVRSVGASLVILKDPRTPERRRKGLARTTQEVSSSLDEFGDPRVSDEDRAAAKKRLEEQSDRLRKEQEDAASAQGLPNVRLGEAAEVCADSLFDAVPDDTLARDLKSVLPEKWNSEGVKDLWKVEEAGDDALDAFAQLRNDRLADARLATDRLVPALARSVPASELFGTLGTPALHCLRAAWLLDRDAGVSAGTWVAMAEEKA